MQRAAVPTVQFEVVVRLQDLVTELGVADPALFEPGLDHLSAEHLVHREMLADVAEKVDRGKLSGPVEVADHDRTGRTGREVEEAADLGPDPRDPVGDDLARVEHPFG